MEEFQKRLKAKSKVGVVRRGLLFLEESTDRGALRAQSEDAARRVRASPEAELDQLDQSRSIDNRRFSKRLPPLLLREVKSKLRQAAGL